jgi:hypothetical protein
MIYLKSTGGLFKNVELADIDWIIKKELSLIAYMVDSALVNDY